MFFSGTYCLRFPPSLVAPNVQMWAVVDGDDWCGEWKAIAPPPSNVPTISSLNPDTLAHGSSPATIDVYGTNYDSTCVVLADGQSRATFYLTNTHLQYTARPDLEPSPATVQIVVESQNGTSNAVTFTFT